MVEVNSKGWKPVPASFGPPSTLTSTPYKVLLEDFNFFIESIVSAEFGRKLFQLAPFRQDCSNGTNGTF